MGKVEIQRSVTQFADGSIDQVGLIAAPGIRVRANREDGLSKKQARELAALLLEAADEMDGVDAMTATTQVRQSRTCPVSSKRHQG